MTTPKHTLALIYGSAREDRFCDILARWLIAALTDHPRFTVAIIDPRDYDLPLTPLKPACSATLRLSRQLDKADGFIILCPDYNHSYSATLKAIIDSAYMEWKTKPVGLVSYGGQSGGLRALERLRGVLARLDAIAMRESLSLAYPWRGLDDHGQWTSPQGADEALDLMLKRLAWWCSLLTQARRENVDMEVV
ncbi:NADPH-dependent FMN reductase [Woodsholea maritima]|uniref:NADPH-dependent FMN reductase n=1 Tax=Woodsholea maritima TaxID=240237 RepID=UPI00036D7F1D|nr:NAD(P)H-dependent oxidoreductase [Woodsholea maritima]